MDGLGERSLVEYGIRNDESDYRAHVGFKTRAVYFFQTSRGKEAVEKASSDRLRTASQPGVSYITACGYVIPWREIKGCVEIPIPEELLPVVNCPRNCSTSEKGRRAIWIVEQMLRQNLIPILPDFLRVKDFGLQRRGKDIIVLFVVSIQVKCDYDAGSMERGGTGNLFLQTAELNPLKRF